ncbi:hypothetical protein FWG95_00540 [Candidatus Saccharibacteria bacterium]|nr:hypothetical protein [Candidatus Saccharibacteria bacterium]
MDGGNQNSVNDDELNQMIANLQGGQAIPPADPSAPTPPLPAAPANAALPAIDPAAAPPPMPVAPQPAPATAVPPVTVPVVGAPPTAAAPALSSGLDDIKHDALNELRPLVNKLNLPPEDKFDTLLLIIRSTDDASLLPTAHMAAKSIPDETRRAQALLDVIKEIDFFGQQGK